MDSYLVNRLNTVKPKNFTQIESIWYEGYRGMWETHYHDSRYHFLNLHSFFHGNHTVELRGFNSTLHAGKIRAYIVFALAMNHQALSQKSARYHKVQEENEKFAMRVYLNRIGFIGDEFKSCREHLYMFDVNKVQHIANRRGFYELVVYLEEHRREYCNFIMTGRE